MIPKEDSLWKKFIRYAVGLAIRHDGTPMRLDKGGPMLFIFLIIWISFPLYKQKIVYRRGSLN